MEIGIVNERAGKAGRAGRFGKLFLVRMKGGFAQGKLGVQSDDEFINVEGFPQSPQRGRGSRGRMCLIMWRASRRVCRGIMCYYNVEDYAQRVQRCRGAGNAEVQCVKLHF